MSEQDYAEVARQYPKHIPFPMIERLHRPGKWPLSEVRSVEDLSSRLLFGDLVDNTFTSYSDGWSVSYRDAEDNGLDISVRNGRFEAKPRFLGKKGLSVGPATHKEAFPQLINLAADQWDQSLKDYLEARYLIRVAETDPHRLHVIYIPDGWLKSILVPIAPSKLGTLLNWHMNLANDDRIGASVIGCVSLLFNAVNYVDGSYPSEWGTGDNLLVRNLLTLNGPMLGQVIHETASDGASAWTLRRNAYLYRCTAYMRDVPRLVESLSAAGLLPDDPDQCAALVPTEDCVATGDMMWWSMNRECRMTWVFENDQMEQFLKDRDTDLDECTDLVVSAMVAGRNHFDFSGLEDLIAKATAGEL